MFKLLKEVTGSEIEEPVDSVGPYKPDGWSVGMLANQGMILSCDGFQVKFDASQLDDFFDVVESGTPGEVRDHDGKIILVEPADDGIILVRTGDKIYPQGVLIGLDDLEHLGIEHFETGEEGEDSNEPISAADQPETEEPEEEEIVTIDEGVKAAFRRSGGKVKRGFRVTSGFRKGRVVASIKGAHKPRAKASTRAKLRLARRKKKVVRILKSKRTRKKSLSKRLARMNKLKK